MSDGGTDLTDETADFDPAEVWDAHESTQEVRLTRETTHECWVGRKDKLLRIEQYLSDALKARYIEELAQVQDGAESRVAPLLARRSQLRVVVTSGKGKIRRSGNLSSVLGEMDLGEVESIEMSNRGAGLGGGSSAVSLKLGVEAQDLQTRMFDGDPGVRLKVSGNDRQWVGGTFDWVATEIAKDVPWWARIRTRTVSVVIGTLLFAGIGGAWLAANGSPKQSDGDEVPLPFIIPLLLMYGVLVGPMFIRPLLWRLFPALELIEPGATSKGRQVMAVTIGVLSLGLSVAGVVLGVLAL